MRLYTTLSVILFSILFFSCKDSDDAPKKMGEWKRLNDFPGEGRTYALSFVVDGKAYMALGLTATAFIKEVWEYDPEKDSWTQKKDFPVPDDAFGGAALGLGDKGYMMVYPEDTDLYSYDPPNDSWDRMPRLPDNAGNFITAFAIDGKGYFATNAQSPGTRNDLWMFDPATVTWTLKAAFPGEPIDRPASFSIGQKGYLGLGLSASNTVANSLYEYDPVSNTWTKKHDAPALVAVEAISFSSASAGYSAMFVPSQNQETPVYKYDPQTDQWNADTTLPSANNLGATTFTIGSRIFVVGGKEVWEFIP